MRYLDPKNDLTLKKSLDVLQESAFSREELEQYDRFWDAVSREKTLIQSALQQGRSIGIEEGRALGLEEGKVLGIEEGAKQKELEKNREIIIRGHENGLSIEILAKLTGLSEGAVTDILKDQ